MSALISGFHHVCIKTRDWERTMAFYRGTLGFTEKIAWQLRGTDRRAVMLDTGDGNYVEVFEDPDYTPSPHGSVIHFALRTDRLDEVAALVRAAGATITIEPKDVTLATTNGAGPVPIRIFFCEGPSGEVIEFFQNTIT
ncbi:MAG: VOC family protein [Opitutaceae bacterium]|nr:VOC family protein [Opitutaceae bacterium]